MGRTHLALVSLAVFGSLGVGSETPEERKELNRKLNRGWGENIDWNTLADVAQNRGKRPAMIIIANSTCEPCRLMAHAFGEDERIVGLSKYFWMINLEESEVPPGDTFTFNGVYQPRMMFTDAYGFVDRMMLNHGPHSDHERLYQYWTVNDIISTMKDAIWKHVRGIDL